MKPVVVTTEFRGVFFGYCEDESTTPERIVLKDARNCVYWDSATKGVLGLASVGPIGSSRVGPKIPSLTAWKVTAVLEATPEAVEKWEQAPWK